MTGRTGHAGKAFFIATLSLLFFLSCNIFFLRQKFPYDSLEKYLSGQIESLIGASASFGKTSPVGVIGLKFSRPEFSFSLGRDKKIKHSFAMDSIEARLKPAALYRFAPVFSYEIRLLGGSIGGVYTGGEGGGLTVNADGVDLGMLDPGLTGGTRLAGILGVDGNIRFPSGFNGVPSGEGPLKISINDGGITLAPGGYLSSPLLLEDISVSADLAVSGGMVKVEKFFIRGRGLNAEIGGEIRLSQKISDVGLNLTIRFRPDQSLKKRFELPLLAIKKDSDGWHEISVTGTISNPMVGRYSK